MTAVTGLVMPRFTTQDVKTACIHIKRIVMHAVFDKHIHDDIRCNKKKTKQKHIKKKFKRELRI